MSGKLSNKVWGHTDKTRERTTDIQTTEQIDFSQMLLSPHVARGLQDAGFFQPSPVQLAAIPLGRFGTDIVVQAKSGTGKTCVFTVIVLENVLLKSKALQAMVLAPTREIADQIKSVFRTIGRHLPGLMVHVFIGGMSIKNDRLHLKHCHVAVGTPGRIKGLMEDGTMDTTSLRMVVLDEADQLFNRSSFGGQLVWILNRLPVRRQTMMYSATYTEEVVQTVTRHMRDPQFVMISADNPSLAGVKQYAAYVDDAGDSYEVFMTKTKRLLQVLEQVPFHQCVVFSNDKGRSGELVQTLTDSGWPAVGIAGGDMIQSDRLAAMGLLRNCKVRVLVSTDLTARGVDIERISLVINLDLPPCADTYLHRVGRTGRFGTLGVAISFVAQDKDRLRLQLFRQLLRTRIEDLPDPLSQIPKRYFSGELLSEEQRVQLEEQDGSKPADQRQDNKERQESQGDSDSPATTSTPEGKAIIPLSCNILPALSKEEEARLRKQIRMTAYPSHKAHTKSKAPHKNRRKKGAEHHTRSYVPFKPGQAPTQRRVVHDDYTLWEAGQEQTAAQATQGVKCTTKADKRLATQAVRKTCAPSLTSGQPEQTLPAQTSATAPHLPQLSHALASPYASTASTAPWFRPRFCHSPLWATALAAAAQFNADARSPFSQSVGHAEKQNPAW